MLSKYEENYLKKYFQIAEVIYEFSVWLLRYNEYTWICASLNVTIVSVGHFKSLQLLGGHIKIQMHPYKRGMQPYLKEKISKKWS